MDNYAHNRALIFISCFLVFSFMETFFSFHQKHSYKPWKRKIFNLAIFFLGALVTKVLQPVILLGLNQQVSLPVNLASVLSLPPIYENILFLFLFDFVIYWQHRLFHTYNSLWSLHSFHHEDYDLDVTSALRFHPLEIFISIAIKFSLILVTGIQIEYYLLFEVLLNSLAMFNHANLYLPPWLEKVLGNILITPRLHVLHHYQPKKYHNMNYGFSIVLWDRLFGTFQWNNSKIEKLNVIGLTGEKHLPENTLKLKAKNLI